MKRYTQNIIIGLFLVVLTMGCTDDKVVTTTHIQPNSFKIDFESDTLKPSIESGQQIGVNGISCPVYSKWVSLKEVPAVEKYFIYYPFSIQRDSTIFKSQLPVTQTYFNNKADLSACPAYAITDNEGLNEVKLKILCGALKIPIPKNDSITTIFSAILSSHRDSLSGTYSWDTPSERFSFMGNNVAKEIDLQGTINIQKGADLCFSLPPESFTDSLFLSFETADGEGTCKIDAKGKSVESGKILVLSPSPISWISKKEYYGKANCIVVKPGSTSVRVDCTPYYTTDRYYSYENHPNKSGKLPRSAKMLWNDASPDFVKNIVMNSDGKSFTANLNGKPGNAVIAIYDKENPEDKDAVILWSYHIWVTELHEQTLGNGYTVLDRNLGALSVIPDDVSSIGLLYQWGRKDPFVSTGEYGINKDANMFDASKKISFTSVSGGSTSGTIGYSIQHPTQFIKYSRSKSNTSTQPYYYSYDWLYFADDALWGNPTGYDYPKLSSLKKSIYDPSPEGYMVAPMDTWQSSAGSETCVFKNAVWKNGFTTENGGWYPIGGWRGRKDGKITSADSNGYYWYSSVSQKKNANVSFMNLNSKGINTFGNNCRANACSVRCVKIK